MTTEEMTTEEIVKEIRNHVARQPDGKRACGEWYVGIAADPKDALFSRHKVERDGGHWIHRLAGSSEQARKIEDELLDLGYDGGRSGGDDDTKSVYAYFQTDSTVR